jgi:N-methylhydantoinase A
VNTHTIGAGGGSIARVVRGTLKVGPDSAGAEPGPACYGRGGREPSSTDAAVVLGLIDPAYFLGGDIALDRGAAHAAVTERVGRPLGLEAAEAALAMVRVQVANMVSGIRAVSVEQGLDPREFALVPFGGAGSLYAGRVAEEMGIGRILVPVYPSVLSALGMLMTDVKYTQVLTRLTPAAAADGTAIRALYHDLEARLATALHEEGIPPARMLLERSCDMRYHGQAYEVNVPVGADRADGAVDVTALVARFHAEHRQSYGQADEREPVELVNFRVTGVGVVPKATLAPRAADAGGPAVPKGERRVYFGSAGWLPCPVFERAALGPATELVGPALVEEAGATIVVYPGHRAVSDALGNLHVALPI